MRLMGLTLLLVSRTVLAQSTCPFDAKVRALADDPAAREAISRTLQAQPVVKRWVAGTRTNCKVAPSVRVVRTLDDLSQRCATALVELELNESECRELHIYNGGGPTRCFAMVAADAKGQLQAVWTLWRVDEPIAPAPPPPGAPIRAECAGALGPDDGGVRSLLAITSDPSLRFDGCTLQGIPEERVRLEVQAALAKSESARVSCRFYEGDPDVPTCAVMTQLPEPQLAVVRSDGFAPGFMGGPAPFGMAAAYFELTDGGARWLCNDLGLDGAPWGPPPAARQGCTPPAAGQRLLRGAAKENEWTTASQTWRGEVWRSEVPVASAADAGVKINRLVRERGRGVVSEQGLAIKLNQWTAALARCAKAPAAYDGAVGTIRIAPTGQLFIDPAYGEGDDECVRSSIKEVFGAMYARVRRNNGWSTYQFRLAVPAANSP